MLITGYKKLNSLRNNSPNFKLQFPTNLAQVTLLEVIILYAT